MFTPDEQKALIDAIQVQNTIREESFLRDSFGYQIGPVKIRPVTLLDTHKLKYLGNKFFAGGIPDESDAAQVLFVLQKREWKRLWIKRGVKALAKIAVRPGVFDEVYDFINYQFADLLEGGGEGGGKDIPFTLFTFEAVDLLAEKYGWKEQDIIRLPITRLAQYINLILIKETGDRPIDLFQKTKLRILERKSQK